MKTRQPLILAAQIEDGDLEPFDVLRRAHFPAERNFLRAHLTMFHRLPGEHLERIIGALQNVTSEASPISAEVAGIRHLGQGVAFIIESADLYKVHAELRSIFLPWLGGQDLQKWRPHITIQNKVARQSADALYRTLSEGFEPSQITIIGLDLWHYMNGPWKHEATIMF
jgi:hypothetical protein